jgi:hypothetical protein
MLAPQTLSWRPNRFFGFFVDTSGRGKDIRCSIFTRVVPILTLCNNTNSVKCVTGGLP